MSPSWPSEVVETWTRVLAASGGTLIAPLIAAVAFFAVCWTDRKPLPGVVARVTVIVAAAVGVVLAARNLSILDDANYSFRYAENWVLGRGLVFNEGERVEGYTNFLWVVILAAGTWLTDFRPHWIALVAGLASFAANVVVLARLGATLHRGTGWLPVAAVLLALHTTFVAFATTGLETMFASLLVDLGLLALLGARPAAASTLLLLATMTRPDHALFWGAGLLTTLLGPDPRRALLRYAVPLLPYAGYLAGKYAYYGSLLPNSYYVRAADEEHVQQGLVYGLTFLLGSHAWLLLAGFLASFALPATTDAQRVFRRFAAVAVPTWVAYVTWVGGDYIYGRFYVVILPMLALGGERVVHTLRDRSAWGAAALAGLFVASAWGLPLLDPRVARWGIADEPAGTDHTWRVLVEGDERRRSTVRYALQDLVDARIPVAVEGTGGFAYRTRLRVVEACGLVDPDIATRARATGAMAGHEKCLTRDDLLDAGVRLSFTRSVFAMGPSPGLPTVEGRPIDALCDDTACIHILAWDADLMRRIDLATDGVRFVDFEAWLDAWLARLPTMDPAEVRGAWPFLHEYYFRLNDDPARLARVKAALGDAPLPPTPAAAGLDGMSGFRERMQEGR